MKERKEIYEIDKDGKKRCKNCYCKKDIEEFRKFIQTKGEYKILSNCKNCRRLDIERKNKKILMNAIYGKLEDKNIVNM